MKKYKIYQVDSFTKDKFAGNPAGVVPNATGLTEKAMQKIARELNNSETAFVFPGDDSSHDVHIRFFTPKTEVPICGHATIAAHYVRALTLSLDSCTVLQKTGLGILPVDIAFNNQNYTITMTQGDIEYGEILTDALLLELAEALGLQQKDFSPRYPVQIVSTGFSKVMIPLRTTEQLHSLSPNMNALIALSEKIGCNGFYPFVLCPSGRDPLVHGRMFAPASGINEDPVTGNANGPLGAYLVKYGSTNVLNGDFVFKARQGEAMGRPGSITVTVTIKEGQPVLVKIAGNAVIVYETELVI